MAKKDFKSFWQQTKDETKDTVQGVMYGTTDGNRRAKRGLITFFIAIVLLVLAVKLFASNNSSTKYSDFDRTYKSGETVNKDTLKSGKKTLYILHRTGCKDCALVEPTVTKFLRKQDSKTLKNVVVYDMKNLSKTNQEKLNQHFNSLLVHGNHMPSPTFIVVSSYGNVDAIDASYSGSDSTKVASFLSDWQKGE